MIDDILEGFSVALKSMICTSITNPLYDNRYGAGGVFQVFLFFDVIDMGVAAGLFWGLQPSSPSVRATLGLVYWVSGLIKILLIPSIRYDHRPCPNPIWNGLAYIFNLFQVDVWFEYMYEKCISWYQGDYDYEQEVDDQIRDTETVKTSKANQV